MVPKSDDEQSDDEFLNKLEQQCKTKQQEIDLDKMTRRQRMAYLAAQNEGCATHSVASINNHNKDSLLALHANENILFALDAKRGKAADDGEASSKPKKTAITQK